MLVPDFYEIYFFSLWEMCFQLPLLHTVRKIAPMLGIHYMRKRHSFVINNFRDASAPLLKSFVVIDDLKMIFWF